jgi:hypothetical protein
MPSGAKLQRCHRQMMLLSGSSRRLCGERLGVGIPPCAANVSVENKSDRFICFLRSEIEKGLKDRKKPPHPIPSPRKAGARELETSMIDCAVI